ncbi:hypothetical protein GCM10010968_17810 [Agrococcus terreus]|uniref:HTH tetR-type domain-containing protein n=2 Tax=Agrococcus terreus TaxID=574649 RepID=A0ABQ2KJS4_9MICO|nr:TetR/AcrR family transcriptional regulator [Agrococcus terreus]GGN85293.1 hypothetical protein GCM10010968_17810 [Agrococcus terreus]
MAREGSAARPRSTPGARGPGRPRASSAATIHEAALELFLERGYDAVSVDDVARRAGVSRGTFFAYCDSKADALWADLDAAIGRAGEALDAAAGAAVPALAEALAAAVAPWGAAPPAALRDAAAMGAAEALRDAAPARLQPLVERAALRLALERDALPESPGAAVAPVALVAAAAAAVVAWAAAPDRGTASDAVAAAVGPLAAGAAGG